MKLKRVETPRLSVNRNTPSGRKHETESIRRVESEGSKRKGRKESSREIYTLAVPVEDFKRVAQPWLANRLGGLGELLSLHMAVAPPPGSLFRNRVERWLEDY